MSQELKACAILVDGRMRYESSIRAYPKIITDYPAPMGSDQGPTSLELFLVSLCTCVGGSISYILTRSKGEFTGLTIRAEASRRGEHPTYFKSVRLGIELVSSTVTEEELREAIEVAESDICPVWNMIKDTVPVTFACSVKSSQFRIDQEARI
jgi:putative redox protein